MGNAPAADILCGNTVAKRAKLVYNRAMKVFKLKFTRTIYIILGFVLAVGAAVFALTLWQVIDFGLRHSAMPAFTIVKYVLMFFVSVALIVIGVLFLTRSFFAVDGKKIKLSFAALPTTYNAEDIDAVVLDRATDRLSIVFKDEKCIFVTISPEKYTDFVQAVLEANPAIEYSIQSKTSTGEDEKK